MNMFHDDKPPDRILTHEKETARIDHPEIGVHMDSQLLHVQKRHHRQFCPLMETPRILTIGVGYVFHISQSKANKKQTKKISSHFRPQHSVQCFYQLCPPERRYFLHQGLLPHLQRRTTRSSCVSILGRLLLRSISVGSPE